MKNKKILLPIFVAALVVFYCIMIFATRNRLPGNTYINGKDCSFMKCDYAADFLTEKIPSRKIVMKNGSETIGEIDVKDYAAMSFKEETIKEISDKTPISDRLLFFLFRFQYDIEPEVIVSSEAINELVKQFGGTEKPVNAYIARDKDTYEFVIVPEVNGNSIDSYTAEDILIDAIENNASEANINCAFIKAGILSTDERLINKTNKLNEDFSDLVIKFVFKNGVSTKTTVLQDKELYDMYKSDEYGVPYISEDGEYEIDSKLAKEFVEKLVPEDYEEFNTDSVSSEGDKKQDKKEQNHEEQKEEKWNDLIGGEENKPGSREKKISELTEWLIISLQKCQSGNKTF